MIALVTEKRDRALIAAMLYSFARVSSRYWSEFIYVETTRDHLRPRISAAAGFDRAPFSPRALFSHGPSGAPRITRAASALVSSDG